jgi:hypothetical protein
MPDQRKEEDNKQAEKTPPKPVTKEEAEQIENDVLKSVVGGADSGAWLDVGGWVRWGNG